MTATANKFGLRAAAAERTKKHAQRTELPARPGVVQEARDLGVGEPRYGEMTVAQLKVEAKRLGLVTYTLRTKGALLNAILKRQQDATDGRLIGIAEAKVDATFEGPSPIDAAFEDEAPVVVKKAKPEPMTNLLPAAYPAEEQLDSPSGRKANAFADKAEALGWAATLHDSQTSEDRVLCVATRKGEAITIEWLNGVFDNQTCFHKTPSGRALKLRNASHALKRMALAPADTAREDSKVSIHTRAKADRSPAGSGTPTAPYFAEDVSDAEVLASVAGKTITWVNGISGGLETDSVAKRSESGEILMKHPASGRSISFLGSAGFRTVRVSAIVAL